LLGGMLVLGFAACAEVGMNKLPSPEEVMATQKGPIQRGEYRLMVGDKLSIKFPYHAAHDQELPVRPDGKISLDVTGEIEAEGMTPAELAEVIKQRSSRTPKWSWSSLASATGASTSAVRSTAPGSSSCRKA
jgi:protein involved in polysaccharide export with SLBB domain